MRIYYIPSHSGGRRRRQCVTLRPWRRHNRNGSGMTSSGWQIDAVVRLIGSKESCAVIPAPLTKQKESWRNCRKTWKRIKPERLWQWASIRPESFRNEFPQRERAVWCFHQIVFRAVRFRCALLGVTFLRHVYGRTVLNPCRFATYYTCPQSQFMYPSII